MQYTVITLRAKFRQRATVWHSCPTSCFGAMFFLVSVEPEHHSRRPAGPPRVQSVGACGELPPKPRFLRHPHSWWSLQPADQLPGTAEHFLFCPFPLAAHCVFIYFFSSSASRCATTCLLCCKKKKKAAQKRQTGQTLNHVTCQMFCFNCL